MSNGIDSLREILGLGFKNQDTLDQLAGPQDGADVHVGVPFVDLAEPVEEPVEIIPEQIKPTFLVCMDSGHGRTTQGKRSPLLNLLISIITLNASRLYEWEFNRDITERIIEQLVALGIPFMRTLPAHSNYGNNLRDRVRNANEYKTDLPKLFVSVHGNAGPARTINDYTGKSVTGIETWYYSKSQKGKRIAAVFHKHIVAKAGLKDRGLKSQPNNEFYVLRATNMPAVLTENGFYNSEIDLPQMIKPEFRQAIADAHVNAIVELQKTGL